MVKEVFDQDITLFAEVILPLALPKNYTYGIPKELEEKVSIGKRVEIQFGKKKIYAGLIKRLHKEPPKEYRVKPVLSVLDTSPIVSETQLKFWEWMADYYLCSEGDVMNAALPAGFKLESATRITLHPDFKDDFTKLNDKEYVVAEALTLQKELSVEEITKILHRKNIYPVIESLLKKNVAIVKEELIERYKPRMETFITLQKEFHSDDALRPLFDELEKKAPKQLELVMAYIHLCLQQGKNYTAILKTDLLDKAKSTDAVLNTLVKKKIFSAEKKEVGRLSETENQIENFELTATQQTALQKIKAGLKEKNVLLLHGVTGSGKTNLYIRLIEDAIAKGKQVLYLLPEIALTAQIINRLRHEFGNKVGIYHSRFNQQERVEIWNKLLRNEYQIILGARSALFLPFESLGLVIVDEEHDSSYKQSDPAPRYNGRDAAIYLASFFHAKTILGSATPALETYQNALQKKFALVILNERYAGLELPEIILSDVANARKRKELHSHFTKFLLDELKETLARKEQAILFQNRRGYAPHVECSVCHWTAQCPNCDVYLTYHKFQNELRCHYCGHRKNNFAQCPACGSAALQITGFGTEKIEDELKIFFPEAIIQRLDLDTARSKHGYQKIIYEFERGKSQILVGTQMVTKGLDFENVSLVGIINADSLLSHSDFRTAERGFQLMSQVSGRSGRKNKRGKVIIQTTEPTNPLLQLVLAHDYEGFFNEELQHREQFFYPPYSRLIQLTFKHREAKKAWEAAHLVAVALQKDLGKNLLGPAEPPVNRVRNQYLVQVLLKLHRSGQMIPAIKQRIHEEMMKLEASALRSVQMIADVDPM